MVSKTSDLASCLWLRGYGRLIRSFFGLLKKDSKQLHYPNSFGDFHAGYQLVCIRTSELKSRWRNAPNRLP
jgi:hypothetical protein